MPDVMQKYPAELCIELVEHSVIADAQLEFRAALQALVRKIAQTCSHFIDLSLYIDLNLPWQIVECLGECARPNL